MHKLEQILRKGKYVGGIIWLVDMNGTPCNTNPNRLTLRTSPPRGSKANRGYADVLLFKRDYLPYLLDSLPRELGLDPVWFR